MACENCEKLQKELDNYKYSVIDITNGFDIVELKKRASKYAQIVRLLSEESVTNDNLRAIINKIFGIIEEE